MTNTITTIGLDLADAYFSCTRLMQRASGVNNLFRRGVLVSDNAPSLAKRTMVQGAIELWWWFTKCA